MLQNLYFIALIPHDELKKQVRLLKEMMKNDYHSSHALKSPAHITLQKSFKRADDFEDNIIKTLSHFTATQKPFEVNLSGFGCFAPGVLYINVTEHGSIINLHRGLKQVLANELRLGDKEINQKLYPHMTIATRDFDKENFNHAWTAYQVRSFEAKFYANSIYLLKHNGKCWDIFCHFPMLLK